MSRADQSPDDEDIVDRTMWRLLIAGLIWGLVTGIQFHLLGKFVEQLAGTFVGLAGFLFILVFAYNIAHHVKNVRRVYGFAILFGAVFYFAGLHLVGGVTAYLSSYFFDANVRALGLAGYYEWWFYSTHYTRFRHADTIAQFAQTYASFFEDIDDLGGLLAAFVNVIMNFIPDFSMYMVAQRDPPGAAFINYGIKVSYWFLPTLLWSAAALTTPRLPVSTSNALRSDMETAVILSMRRHEYLCPTLRFANETIWQNSTDLVFFDNEASREGSAAAAARVVASGARAVILGPMDEEEFSGVLPILRAGNVQPVGYNASPAAREQGAVSLGWSFIDEADVLISAALRSGVSSFSALIDDPYLEEIAREEIQRFRSAVVKAGAQFIDIEPYSSDERRNIELLTKLSGAMRQRIGLIMSDPHFAKNVLEYFANQPAPPVRPLLLGTSSWFHRAPFGGGVLEGATLVAPSGLQRVPNVEEPLHRTQVLMASDIVCVVERLRQLGGVEDAGRMLRTEEFKSLGPFRFRANGTVQRTHTIYEVRNGQSKAVGHMVPK